MVILDGSPNGMFCLDMAGRGEGGGGKQGSMLGHDQSELLQCTNAVSKFAAISPVTIPAPTQLQLEAKYKSNKPVASLGQ